MPERMVHTRIRNFRQDLLDFADTVITSLSCTLDTAEWGATERIVHFRHIDQIATLKEIDLEVRCLTFLAVEHPTAIDLRTMVSIMKTKDDLKRISDLSLHIAERMPDMSPELFESFRFETIGKLAVEMAEKSMAAFRTQELSLSSQVFEIREELHLELQNIFRTATLLMNRTKIEPDQLLAALSVSRHLGLIGDHAGDIARTAHYFVTGDLIPRKATFDNQLTASLELSRN
jgi:phosphate transport system protein